MESLEIITNLNLEKQTCEDTVVLGNKREANANLAILWFKVRMKLYFVERENYCFVSRSLVRSGYRISSLSRLSNDEVSGQSNIFLKFSKLREPIPSELLYVDREPPWFWFFSTDDSNFFPGLNEHSLLNVSTYSVLTANDNIVIPLQYLRLTSA